MQQSIEQRESRLSSLENGDPKDHQLGGMQRLSDKPRQIDPQTSLVVAPDAPRLGRDPSLESLEFEREADVSASPDKVDDDDDLARRESAVRFSRVSREERPIMLSNLTLQKNYEVGPDSDPSQFKLAGDFHGEAQTSDRGSSSHRRAAPPRSKRTQWGERRAGQITNSSAARRKK